MAQRRQDTRRRPTADEIETWAFDLLRRQLIERGHLVTRIRRPDRANRASRDVDFLAEVDGRDVAVEVTQLDQARKWWNLLDRLETQVRESLHWDDMEADPGWLMFSMNLLRTGSYREVETAGAQIAAAIHAAPVDFASRAWERLHDLPEPADSLVEVEVNRPSMTGKRLSFVNGHDAHGPQIAPRALAFVRQLITSKGTQATGYGEVWILVIDNELIIDIDQLAAAFALERQRLPPNWTRLFFIPAANRTAIQTLELRSPGDP